LGPELIFPATAIRFTSKSITELTDSATGTLFPAGPAPARHPARQQS
jgi:hypothetical protein